MFAIYSEGDFLEDSKTTVSELKYAVQRFSEARDWDQFHSPKELAIGASTEAAELLEIFRFKTEKQMEEILKDEKQRERIGEELADVLVFLVRFAQMYGFDLSRSTESKLKKNESKYPVEGFRGSNRKYDEP
jgi:NTP pyrophosphatase (non-canonical NTP hydrolase)